MATGTGNLPYPMSPVSPFDVITSQAENERIANIESLADGTGVGDKAITAPKIDFTTLPKFRAYKGTNSQALTGNSITAITFQVVDYNVGGGFSTSTNEFTAPVAGVYEFGARVRFDGGSGTPERTVALRVEGSIVSSSAMFIGVSGWSGNCIDQLSLTAGQKVTVAVYTTTAGSTAQDGYNTSFWGRRVG